MGLGVKLRPSPPMWKISFRCAREQRFPLYLKKINCFEEMFYRKIDFTFWGLTLFEMALKCITLNKMKKSIVHYGDKALVFASTKNLVSTTYFECTIRKVPYRGLGVKLRPSPPMWKISFRLAREHSFPLYQKKINCFEEMMNRKIDFTYWGVTLCQRALKCITLNKMKKGIVHYGDKALVFASTKNYVSTSYFECTIRKFPYRGLGVKLRPSPPMWKISFRLAREHSFPLYQKKINCFEEMFYRKIDFTFWGLTLFEMALKCITLNKMKKA